MAPQTDNLSPAGSSTYSSNTMYVGDGTWDATRNDFLLPNLVGLNFATMQYNGMGNRFRDFAGYHGLIKAHGIMAVITFLFIVPAAIFISRFYGGSRQWSRRMHIYLQVIALGLTTALFVVGWIAVGPNRSLTNPHHGIGLAIYVIILVQAIGGRWVYNREKKRVRRGKSLTATLHHWIGRAVALLGIVQVALGLTLYGSPKFTFVLYTLWMTFLLLLYFILQYRISDSHHDLRHMSGPSGTIIEEKKKSGRSWLAPLAAGGGLFYLLSRRKSNRERSRSRSRSRPEVIPSRHGSRRDSESFIEDEKYESRRKDDGFMDKIFKGAAVVGAGALAKSWWDRRQEKKRGGDDYSSVAHDTPSKRRRRHDSISEESVSVMEQGRRPGGNLLPGPGPNPALAASAISAAERPVTPRPARHARSDSMESSYFTESPSPSRRPQKESHTLRDTVIGAIGLGWIGKKLKDRRDQKEEDRLRREDEQQRIEQERVARAGRNPSGPRFTGDGAPPARRQQRPPPASYTESSDLSSIIDDRHEIRPGAIPPIPAAAFGAGAGAGAAMASGGRSQSNLNPNVPPPGPPPAQQPPYAQDSGSESYFSQGAPQRRTSSRRRREGEEAAAAAVAGAAGLAAEEASRRRSRSKEDREGFENVYGIPPVQYGADPVSVKVKVHGDKDRNVTLRRLTKEEAAADRAARRQNRSGSMSSLSGTESMANNRRYRRERRENEMAAEKRAEADLPPPSMAPLSPPNPAFAGGRRPKDSAYYSGGRADGSAPNLPLGSNASRESHGTWSAMSPGSGSDAAAAERRRRRRMERRPAGQTTEFT